MDRREKQTTERREEEWKKKLQIILNEITCHTLVNNTERKKAKMKSTKHETIEWKEVIGLVISLLIFVLFLIAISCNWCTFTNNGNTIVSFVGIVLSFIGIVLSFKSIQISNMGLKVAGGIRDQIALQQREEVVKMIKVINEFKIWLFFGEFENGKPNNCVGIYRTNIFGILEVDKSIREEAPDFETSTLCFAESFSYPFIDQFITSPNIPISISEHLQLLDRSFFKETQNPLMGKCVVVDEYDKTCSNYRQSKSNCSDWKTLTSHVEQLKLSIENWYKDTGINETPNLRGLMQEIIP